MAQRIARLIPIQKATGSIPVGRANFFCLSRDVAQLGSALASGARGRRFKSCRPDQEFGAVAQLEEHNAGSVGVEGSSPFSSTRKQHHLLTKKFVSGGFIL